MNNQLFTPEEPVLLDDKHTVYVVSQTPNRLFTMIKADPEDADKSAWEVMTNRLSKIEEDA